MSATAAAPRPAPAIPREPASRPPLPLRLAPPLLALAVYAIAACFFTWPAVTDLDDTFYGAAGDPYGTMATYREWVEEGQLPFLPGTVADFNAPEGQPVPWVRNLASLPGVMALWTLTALFGPVAATNLYAMGGLVLTGLATFLLARRLTASVWPALIAGWAFAFYPFAVLNAQGHYDKAYGVVLVLGVWRMLELLERPTVRNGVLAGAAVVIGMWWSPYFLLLGGVSWATLAVAGLAIAGLRGAFRAALRPQLVAGAIVGMFLVALLGLSTLVEGESLGVRSNPIEALVTYSARPLEYVLPPATNPLVGDLTGPLIAERLHGSNLTESTLYVGVTVIALALVALVAAPGRRRPSPAGGATVGALAALVVVALVFSAPPEAVVLGQTIPFPSRFVAEVTSTWRAYSRFVMLVMLGLALLAAVGLSVLARRRSALGGAAVLLLAAVAVPVDLWGRLPGRTNTIVAPDVYHALARQPADGLVAEYPLVPTGFNTYNDLFFQQVHGKPMINGYYQGTPEEARALSLARLSDPTTAQRLDLLGVRYVLVRREEPGYGLLGPGRPTRDFRRLGGDAYGTLYRVAPVRRAFAFAATGTGFTVPERDAEGEYRWTTEAEAELVVEGRCAPCRGTLRFDVASFARRPRTVTLSTPSGRVLWRRRVVDRTPVRVPLVLRGRQTLALTADPGPQPVAEVTGTPDPRSLSLQLRDLRFVPERSG